MSRCDKHGYNNGTFCPACDIETVAKEAAAKVIEQRQYSAFHETISGGDARAIRVLKKAALQSPPANKEKSNGT